MSLDKAIASGKEHRKPLISRCSKSCNACRSNKTRSDRLRALAAKEKIEEVGDATNPTE